LTAAAVVAALALAMSSCAARGTWTVLEAPFKGGMAKAFPSGGLSCAGPTMCLAIGSAGEPATQAWDGTTWRSVPDPQVPQIVPGTLNCASPTWCVVFGKSAHAVWDGAAWTAGPDEIPSPSTYLGAVSCPAVGVCFGLGDDHDTSVDTLERWDGRRWSRIAGDPYDYPFNLSCSDADTCTVLHSNDPTTVISRWDSGQWSTLPVTGPPTWFGGLACATDTMCALVGHSGLPHRAVAATWTGGPTVDAALVPGATLEGYSADLTHVSCSGVSSCLAQSESAEGAQFDGTRWRVVAQPRGPQTYLAALTVACPSPDRCFEVLDFDTMLISETLWQWDGASFHQVAVDGIGTEPVASLTDVACPTTTTCLAVGTYRTGTLTGVLTERWDGTTWSLAPDIPVAPDTAAAQPLVDCSSATACVAAVGVGRGAAARQLVLASWDGSAWHAVDAGTVAPVAGGATPSDVSCSAPASCIVIAQPASTTSRLAIRWDGSAWATMPAPLDEPAGARPTRTRLSCASPRFCALITTAFANGGMADTAQAWNGSSWAFLPAPLSRAAGAFDDVRDIDCPTDNNCVAAGQESIAGPIPDAPGLRYDVVATWNGLYWSVQRLTGSHRGALSAVSCASVDHCLAVTSGQSPSERNEWVYGVTGGRSGWAPTSSPPFNPTPPPDTALTWDVAANAVSCAGNGCQVVGDKSRFPFLQTRAPIALRFHW
jgi:hypothetical protein